MNTNTTTNYPYELIGDIVSPYHNNTTNTYIGTYVYSFALTSEHYTTFIDDPPIIKDDATYEWDIEVNKTYKSQLIKISSISKEDCLICLSDFSKRHKAYITNCCRKLFHSSCLKKWLGNNETCPHCRDSPYEFVLKNVKTKIPITIVEAQGVDWIPIQDKLKNLIRKIEKIKKEIYK